MKSGFLDKLIERLDKLDPQSLQTHFLRLAQEKGLLETIFQAVQEGIVVLDGEGRISYANRAAEDMLGLRPDTWRGRPITKYLEEVDWSRIIAFDTGEWSRLVKQEIEVRHPARRILSFYVVPLAMVESHASGAVVMLRDVTRDREREASVVESERHDAVRLLAAGVAHEIGNPLNALTIHLQLLDRELKRLPAEQAEGLLELLTIARTEVARLDTIISQFLRAIRPSKPRLGAARIDTLIRDTLAVLKQEIENRSLQVNVELPEPIPRVHADRNQMKQAFFNVIKNAFEAMQPGGTLDIVVTADDRCVSVAFRDSGAGIAPEDFGRIFEPYHTTKEKGTGIGLMIVQRIVQDHGGRIEVFSKPGEGTTVVIVLPLDERRVRLLKAH